MTRPTEDSVQRPNPPRRFRFSLRYLIVLTAIVAAWAAAFVARQENFKLRPQMDRIRNLSGRLDVVDSSELVCVSLPKIADEFEWWDVYVPAGKPQEVRLHCGYVSVAGLPQQFDSEPLSTGRHQVVFRALDNAEESFRYEVYVDGRSVIEKQMGSDWLPKGWERSSEFSPREKEEVAGKFLMGCRYLPEVGFMSKRRVDRDEYFQGQLDRWSTELGYELWIDEVGRSPKPIDPFLRCLLYTSPSPRDGLLSRMPSSA